jgi:hypothetical protein
MQKIGTTKFSPHKINSHVKKTKNDYNFEDRFLKKGNSQLNIREITDKKIAYNVVRMY